MSLSVVYNQDGTVTVSCGSEKVTIQKPGAEGPTVILAPLPSSPSATPISYPPGGGGAKVAEIDLDPHGIGEFSSSDIDSVVQLIQGHVRSEPFGPKLMGLRWNPSSTLDVQRITRALDELKNETGNQDLMCAFHLPDLEIK